MARVMMAVVALLLGACSSVATKPVAITFHTVLPSPSLERVRMMRALAGRAVDVIVLTQRSARILREEYAVAASKITVIAQAQAGRDRAAAVYTVDDRPGSLRSRGLFGRL